MNSISIAAPNAGSAGVVRRADVQLRRNCDLILIPQKPQAVLDEVPDRELRSFRGTIKAASIGAGIGFVYAVVLVEILIHAGVFK